MKLLNISFVGNASIKHIFKLLRFKSKIRVNGPFPLLRYFSIVSFISMLIAALLLASLYRNISVENLLQYGEEKNAVLAQVLANSIWPEFEPFLPIAAKLDQQQLRAHPKTKKMLVLVKKYVAGLDVLKIKIFDLHGFTIFSTDVSQIGIQKPAGYLGIVSARTGQPISQLSFREKINSINGMKYHRHVIASYLPIRDPNSNNVEGVFEVYYDVTDLFEQIEKTKSYIGVGVVLILLVLYGALFYLVRHADNIMKQQSQLLILKHEQSLAATNAKSDFLANMSHELRTPLNAIIGYSEMLIDENDDDSSLSNDLMKIRNAGKHLLHLVNSILDISKIEAGKMSNYIEYMDVDSTVEKIIEATMHGAKKKKNKIVTKIESGISMETDITKFKQIIFNLVGNAIKFTKNGTVSIQLSCKQVNSVEWIFIEVSDTGIGMSIEQQQIVFESFTQAEDSTTRKYGGTGLGLSITKHLCALLGGTISVKSEANEGAIFFVKLPRCTPRNEENHVNES